MSAQLNDIISDGTAKFQVVKTATTKDLNNLDNFWDSTGTIGAGILETMGLCQDNAKELDKWNNQRIQQGVAYIYNKFVIKGCVINAVANSRNIQFTKTGTYVSSNFSTAYLNGQVININDKNSGIYTIPKNTSSSSIIYYVYIDTNGAIKCSTTLPSNVCSLYRITVPASDSASNLNNCTFTDIRRIEPMYKFMYSSMPYTTITITGYPLTNAPNYNVVCSIISADDIGNTALEVYDKTANTFKIRNRGTSDNVVIQYAIIDNFV